MNDPRIAFHACPPAGMKRVPLPTSQATFQTVQLTASAEINTYNPQVYVIQENTVTVSASLLALRVGTGWAELTAWCVIEAQGLEPAGPSLDAMRGVRAWLAGLSSCCCSGGVTPSSHVPVGRFPSRSRSPMRKLRSPPGSLWGVSSQGSSCS